MAGTSDVHPVVQFLVGNMTERLLKWNGQFMQRTALHLAVQFQVVADEFSDVCFRSEPHSPRFAFDRQYLSGPQADIFERLSDHLENYTARDMK